MAHTDRDRRNWMRSNHGKDPAAGECTNNWRTRWRAEPRHCEICDTLWDGIRFYVSTDAYSEWAKDERRTERSNAKRAMRECKDWDELSIRYRRPYFD